MILRTALLSLLAGAGMAATVREALPERTLAVVELPAPATAAAKLEGTRLGAYLLDRGRRDAVLALLRKHQADEMRAFEEGMAKVGMGMDDLAGLLAGRCGVAVAAHRHPERGAQVLITMWTEPGEALVGKMVAAVERLAADGTVKMVAEELVGRRVLSVTGSDVQADSAEPMAMLVADGGRMLAFVGEQREAADLRTLAGETLTRLAGTGEGGMQARLQATPFLARGPAGTPLIEAVFDPRPLLASLPEAERAEVMPKLVAMGVDQSHGAAMGMSIDEGGVLRTSMRIHAPAPRRGIPAMLDDAALTPPAIPAWADASVVSFMSLAVDLRRMYERVRELTVAISPDSALGFDMANTQASGMLGHDIPTLLAAFKGPIIAMAYPKPKADQRAAGEGVEAPAASAQQDPVVFALPLADEAMLKGVVRKLIPLAGGAVALEDEPEAMTIRSPMADTVSAAIARGHLVIAVGKDLLARALGNLATPPAGEAALATQPWVRRALAQIQPGPTVGLALEHQREAVGGAMDDLLGILLSQAFAGADGLGDELRRIIPDSAQTREMFDVGGGSLRMVADGWAFDSAGLLPLR